jgi:hypothetical protein
MAPTATPNSANYDFVVGNLTDVGAYTGTTSPSGAFDMNGNVSQWNEAIILGSRYERGGSFDVFSDGLLSELRVDTSPTAALDDLGFRVASIPEPSSLALCGLAAICYFALPSFHSRWIHRVA